MKAFAAVCIAVFVLAAMTVDFTLMLADHYERRATADRRTEQQLQADLERQCRLAFPTSKQTQLACMERSL